MPKISFGRQYISIDKIGRTRFWIGVVYGLLVAIILAFLFTYFKELFRFGSMVQTDLIILTESENRFYDLFFAALATSLGFNITIWAWMSDFRRTYKSKLIYKRLIQCYALLFFWVTLMLLTRLGTILTIFPYGTTEINCQFDFIKDFGIICYLLPIVIFLQNWSTMRLLYKSSKWILCTLLACITTMFTLNYFIKADQNKLNQAYFNYHKEAFNYIDQEFEKAKINYNITFDENTIKTLKKRHTQNALEQVDAVRQAFTNGQQVSLDTIILEKIMFQNLKIGHNGIRADFRPYLWSHALPWEIFHQIKKHNKASPELYELFEILKIQFQHFQPIDQRQEMDEEIAIYNKFSNHIQKQFISVRDSLAKEGLYDQYLESIPELKLDHY